MNVAQLSPLRVEAARVRGVRHAAVLRCCCSGRLASRDIGGPRAGPDREDAAGTCGKTALNLLLITLLVTPVRQLAGWPHVLRLRRMLGLFAFFFYVSCTSPSTSARPGL